MTLSQRQTSMNTHSQPNGNVILMETGVHWENPCMHWEKMQTPNRKVQLRLETGALLLWGDGANSHATVQLLFPFDFITFICWFVHPFVFTFEVVLNECWVPRENPQMSLGVSVCLVCLCVALWWTADLSRVYPASRPVTAGMGSSLPVNPKFDSAGI